MSGCHVVLQIYRRKRHPAIHFALAIQGSLNALDFRDLAAKRNIATQLSYAIAGDLQFRNLANILYGVKPSGFRMLEMPVIRALYIPISP